MAIIISTLVCPSTWVLVAVVLLYSQTSPHFLYKEALAWLILIGTILHAARELIKDLPWLGRAVPPPGLHCTASEWNSEFVGKPLFALQMVWLTVIRGLTVFFLLRWILGTSGTP
jgi:hypothetical protein